MIDERLSHAEREIASSRIVATYGLSESQLDVVRASLPSADYEINDVEDVADLVASLAVALVINAAELDSDAPGTAISCLDFLIDMGEGAFSAIIWIGEIEQPKALPRHVRSYSSFEEAAGSLKYDLLRANRKHKKTSELSKTLGYALMILASIRKNPGITTRELAKSCELSERSVQRYIATLRGAGEWIDYDEATKGWSLQAGFSVLMADHFEEEWGKLR